MQAWQPTPSEKNIRVWWPRKDAVVKGVPETTLVSENAGALAPTRAGAGACAGAAHLDGRGAAAVAAESDRDGDQHNGDDRDRRVAAATREPLAGLGAAVFLLGTEASLTQCLLLLDSVGHGHHFFGFI